MPAASRDDKGMATIDSNLEWVRLAQRVPVRIRLDNQQENIWPAGTTATVVVTGKQDRDESQDSFFRKWLIACVSLVNHDGYFLHC